MLKSSQFRFFLISSLVNLNFAIPVNAQPTAKLTVVVKGIHHQKGQVCLRVYSGEEGFPFSDTSEVQSGCVKITGSSITKNFQGLKPGTYAVAVVDDQNGDYKLNSNFLGIPQEGFGVSKNPTISARTGAPKFQQASFPLKKDTKINIVIKYSLDP
ncbi:DUF2141 domain-containing protein [Nostoc sp. CENA67]|uniref:DUF2141 domain-containing protein n=1 Tax=Amazonocrinis nigriterrae CENA67 TaxID=2794033 RepID=A0A8J7HR35_9NOST|nr:DUF2141 domain-containing protein [Amazonocrinis nigriterrae]MBH8564117.1 DUF2141 domain-containing protein [Amazonocrinis nigriterrae CENA67]